jgi:hypothetical protein
VPELSNLDKPAQKAVVDVLESFEELLVTKPGESSALVATNRRILSCKWGATSGATVVQTAGGPGGHEVLAPRQETDVGVGILGI